MKCWKKYVLCAACVGCMGLLAGCGRNDRVAETEKGMKNSSVSETDGMTARDGMGTDVTDTKNSTGETTRSGAQTEKEKTREEKRAEEQAAENGTTGNGTAAGNGAAAGDIAQTEDHTRVNEVTDGQEGGLGQAAEELVDGVGEAGKDVIDGVENAGDALTGREPENTKR